MSLSNVATFVVLPPVNLLGVALAGAAWSFRTRRAGQAVALGSLLALAVLSTPFVAGWLLVALEEGLPLRPDPANPPEAVVVLGGDVDRQADGTSVPGPLTLERIRAGAALARRTGLPLLVTGGLTSDDTAAVCAVMADSLRDDFRLEARWRECRSVDTWENAGMSAAMLERDGIHAAFVVTHPWHMRRAVLAFSRTGLAVTAATAGMDGAPTLQVGAFVPSAKGLQNAYWAVHEWTGLVYYEGRLLMR